jgi:hypothetical protein
MKASTTVKKNARSWAVARSAAHKNLRWRMASEQRPNNSNFKHTKTVGVGIRQFWDCVVILGIEVAAGKGLGPEGPSYRMCFKSRRSDPKGPTSKKPVLLGSVWLRDDGIGFVWIDG